MCLRQGLYVLAAARGRGSGFALLYIPGMPGAPGTPERYEEIITGHVLGESDQDEWGWSSFEVDERTCFRLWVENARSRVYEVRVGVDW